jgi:D-lactate dehydrogenase
VGPVEGRAWQNAARHWDVVTTAAAGALTAATHLPVGGVTAASVAARRVLGQDKVPIYDAGLPRGGHRRRGRAATAGAEAVYFPACVGAMFGPADGSPGVKVAFEALCRRAGIAVQIPASIARLCCGTPWKSKGFTAGVNDMRQLVATELRNAAAGGALPVVCDASSCTEGLIATVPDLVVLDLTAFVADIVLPALTVSRPLSSLVLHPTCSTTKLDAGGGLRRLASAISDEVVIPDEWRCCAFAGDRGLLHPELTASATEPAAAQLRSETYSAYASTNRTCEIAMTRATGRVYRHIVELVEEATRPQASAGPPPSG